MKTTGGETLETSNALQTTIMVRSAPCQVTSDSAIMEPEFGETSRHRGARNMNREMADVEDGTANKYLGITSRELGSKGKDSHHLVGTASKHSGTTDNGLGPM